MSDLIQCPGCGATETYRCDGNYYFVCGSYIDGEGFNQSGSCSVWFVSELKRKVGELEIAFKRYERLRRMNPREFSDLYDRCIRDDINFDSAVDCLIATGQ